MSNSVTTIGAALYGVRVAAWRPVHAAVFVAVITIAYASYYLWAQSETGMDFFLGYAEAAVGLGLGDLGQFFEYLGIMSLAGAVFTLLLQAAGARVYLRDALRPFFVFQLGPDELRLIPVNLILLLVAIGLYIVLGIVLVVVLTIIGVVAGVSGGLNGAPASDAFTLMATAMGVLIMVPIVYVIGRFAVAIPLTIRDRRLRLNVWAASRGHGLKLLAAHLLLYFGMMAAQFLLAPDLMRMVFDPQFAQQITLDPPAFAQQMANPYGDLLWIGAAVQAGFIFLLFGPTAAVAKATPSA